MAATASGSRCLRPARDRLTPQRLALFAGDQKPCCPTRHRCFSYCAENLARRKADRAGAPRRQSISAFSGGLRTSARMIREPPRTRRPASPPLAPPISVCRPCVRRLQPTPGSLPPFQPSGSRTRCAGACHPRESPRCATASVIRAGLHRWRVSNQDVSREISMRLRSFASRSSRVSNAHPWRRAVMA